MHTIKASGIGAETWQNHTQNRKELPMQNSFKTSAKTDVGLAQNDVMTFNSAEFGNVRTVIIDGEPWFVGKDVADSLGYSNSRKALSDHVDDEDKRQGDGVTIRDPIGRKQNPTIINESGVYALVFGSKLESARKFKHWVTSEVLPSIRKTGGYSVPKTYADALMLAAEQAKRIEEQQRTIAEQKPKVEFYDTAMSADTSFLMGDVAKILGLRYGSVTLFGKLRKAEILQKDNTPYQEYMNRGYFKVVEHPYTTNHGEHFVNKTTRVYQKGMDFIRKLLKEDIKE